MYFSHSSKTLLRFAVGMLMMWGLPGCLTFRTTDKQVHRYFKKKDIEPLVHTLNFKDKKIRIIETSNSDDPELPLVLFVHGAPGSSDVFYNYLADAVLLDKARLVAIDRLGYGYSDFGRSEVSIQTQAEMVNFVAEHFEAKDVIVVGHSFGGPVAAKYAMDFPTHVKGVLMLAPAIDPENEKVFWFSHIGKWKWTRWMVPAPLKVASDEKFAHEAELHSFVHQWKELNMPVIHMHGKKDRIVPFVNVAFSKSHIKKTNLKIVEMEKEDHYIPWTQYEAVRREILLLLKPEGI